MISFSIKGNELIKHKKDINMRGLRHSIYYKGLLINLSYFFITIGIVCANILCVVVLHDYYLGLIIQGCFYSGCVIGSMISIPLLKILSKVKSLIVCTLIASLYPIVYPISEIWDKWESIIVVIVLCVLSGIGTTIFTIAHALPLIQLQQASKRSPCLGIQTGMLPLSGCIAGILICLPSLLQKPYESWHLALISGIFSSISLIINLLVKDEEIIIGDNRGITLHYLSFSLSYFSIGVISI